MPLNRFNLPPESIGFQLTLGSWTALKPRPGAKESQHGASQKAMPLGNYHRRPIDGVALDRIKSLVGLIERKQRHHRSQIDFRREV